MDKKYIWERLTASREVSPNPVNLACIIVVAHKSKQAEATLYDGESTNDPVKLHIHTLSGVS